MFYGADLDVRTEDYELATTWDKEAIERAIRDEPQRRRDDTPTPQSMH